MRYRIIDLSLICQYVGNNLYSSTILTGRGVGGRSRTTVIIIDIINRITLRRQNWVSRRKVKSELIIVVRVKYHLYKRIRFSYCGRCFGRLASTRLVREPSRIATLRSQKKIFLSKRPLLDGAEISNGRSNNKTLQ